tara:strand:- start:695 stop:1030 length:336 start_codon:yes stop_codon:yes gene_type:complete
MRLINRITISIVIFLGIILWGGFAYNQIEDWRYLDSVYFTVITVTTIGYGDFSPQTDLGKLFTIGFSFLGIAMAFYFFSLLGRFMFRKHLREKLKDAGRIKRRRGIKRVRR